MSIGGEHVEVTAGTDVTEAFDEQINVVYSDDTALIEGVDIEVRQVAAQLQAWVRSTGEAGNGSLADPKRFALSNRPFANIARAHHVLASNDLIGGMAEVTEGIAFQGMQWESSDADVADVWNQMAAEQNLDGALRKAWREQFATSQVIVGMWWDTGTFKVRGKTKAGNKRKASMAIHYPRRLTIMDPTRVVPVGLLMFGQERLAWVATAAEVAAYEAMRRDELFDPLMARLFVGRYYPEGLERHELIAEGIDVDRLILLDHHNVRRHTATRSDYERWAPVRLRGLFPLLDLRDQLMEADRVSIVGAANYILLVKKGDKDNPGKASEIANLKEGFRTLARVPVIFSDHRLSIEIITPKQDFVLQREKYDLLDARIARRLLSSIATGTEARAGTEGGGMTVGKVTAKVLQGNRHMLRRFLEEILARAVLEHPANAELFPGAQPPSLTFIPNQITLVDDASAAQQIMALRTQKEISRESVLEYFGLDQGVEAMRRELEEEQFDDIFQTQVPFSSPSLGAPANQGPRGAEGGRPVGGGTPSANPTKTARTPSGNTPRKDS